MEESKIMVSGERVKDNGHAWKRSKSGSFRRKAKWTGRAVPLAAQKNRSRP
jgi:hypothetical protein